MANGQQQFSAEDIERMRSLVAQHDSTTGKIEEFDLNNPPRKPYTYKPFPKVMYHHGKRITRVAQNAEEMEAALKAGWKKEPFPDEPENGPGPDAEPSTKPRRGAKQDKE